MMRGICSYFPYGMALGAVLMILAASQATAFAAPAQEIARFGAPAQGTPACASCHGLEGEGNDVSGIPRLAGLPATYLSAQLEALADRQRDNAMMSPVAETLSREQRQALARYYAALPIPAAAAGPAVSVDDAIVELVEHGRPEAGVPGCAQCHGENGVGVGERFPPLAGQSATYLVHQLENWQQHRRPDGPQGLMGAIAQRLDPSTFQALADYLAAQPPVQSTAEPAVPSTTSDHGETP